MTRILWRRLIRAEPLRDPSHDFVVSSGQCVYPLSERIDIDDSPVTEAALARAAQAVLPHVRATRGTPTAPTFFELFTAIAWVVFKEAGCEYVVLETGLGNKGPFALNWAVEVWYALAQKS